MNYDAYSMMLDFAFMSLLLIVAQFLRAKVKFFQKFYIPASVLAGSMGLICGPQVLNIIPVSYTHLDVYKRQSWSRGFISG